MGPTYDLVNRVSSLGFCEVWRYQCVRHLPIHAGSVVCDMMSGSGECWPYILSQKPSRLVSIDFSSVMVERQRKRLDRVPRIVAIHHENATQTRLASESVDFVIGAFGLKTLSPACLAAFVAEIRRILKPGGAFSLLEISNPSGWVLGGPYRWYVSRIIPLIGSVLLGDIECYRMLGVYTESFGSCERVRPVFEVGGFEVEVRSHFFGCATALVGKKPPLERGAG
jgi:demethylmenaquinone methyltransferase/2-methoxy-6-polyprenyl-1,4-benzoquinol methylase